MVMSTASIGFMVGIIKMTIPHITAITVDVIFTCCQVSLSIGPVAIFLLYYQFVKLHTVCTDEFKFIHAVFQ